MTRRQELLAVPKRKWDEELEDVRGVFVIPNRKKHDSGWRCMDFVAEVGEDLQLVRFGGYTDAVTFHGSNFHMDCEMASGLVHIWNRNTFIVTADLSSVDFIEVGGDYYNMIYAPVKRKWRNE